MIDLQQPKPLDLVGNPVLVAGQSLVFEANIEWRATLGGTEANGFFTGGGSVAVRQFQTSLDLSALLASGPTAGALAQLSLFSTSAKDGSVENLVSVPMILGAGLVSEFEGWQPRTISAGDTLSSIAGDVYGNTNAWPSLFEANRDRLTDPNLIQVGQVLRVPIGSAPLILA